MKNKPLHKTIRIPVPPPSIVMKDKQNKRVKKFDYKKELENH